MASGSSFGFRFDDRRISECVGFEPSLLGFENNVDQVKSPSLRSRRDRLRGDSLAAQSPRARDGGDSKAPKTEEHGKSLGGIALAGIALALVAFYVWLGQPPKVPPPVKGRILTPHDQLMSISSIGSESWVVGTYGLILHLSNGSRGRSVQRSGTESTLTGVSFGDSDNGFAVGAVGTIVATHDGKTWVKQYSGTTNQLLSVAALGPRKAFVSGAYGTLLTTADGGEHWQSVALPWNKLIPGLLKNYPGLEPNLNMIFFAGPQVGWIVGEFGIVLKTVDGGETWNEQRSGGSMPQLYSIACENALRCWAVGQSGSVIRTTDGGAHWLDAQLPIKQGTNLFAVAIKGKYGVVVGDQIILATRDGGVIWTQLDKLKVAGWLAGVSLLGNRAIAVGQAATLVSFNLP